jgi:Tfp pilus assembly protein PilF
MKKADLAKALALLRQGDWQAAHAIVQKDEDSPLACWAHGIVHLMEGDTSNARYWYREAKREFPRQPSISEEIDSLDAALNS